MKRQTSTGFKRTSGEIRKAVTKSHTTQDVGQVFEDNFKRVYIYTKKGLIY